MNKTLAPIALFCYRRIDVLKQTIEALKQNQEAKDSMLFIFSDGFKSEDDKKGVEEVREYIKTVDGFKNIEIIEAEKNKGLANFIIHGVTRIVNEYGKIIVVEDDILTGQYFLKYMNDALDMYENEDDVACISGYVYPIKTKKQTFFIKGSDCWGWATWKRAWEIFQPDGKKLLNEIEEKNLQKEFDFNSSYAYTQMLKDQIEGKNNSWAIRWYASCFLKNKLCLYPGKTLVQNIGIGTEGATHCEGKTKKFDSKILNKPLNLEKIKTLQDKKDVEIFCKYFNRKFGKKMNNFMLKKEKIGNKRKITILGYIKFSYKKKRKIKNNDEVNFFGDFNSWHEALEELKGNDYSKANILQKTLESTLKVKSGEAVFERDSYIFDKIQYSFPLLTCLFKAAIENNNKLNILDFGGALGSHYFQNKDFLKPIIIENWSVIEQPHYVKAGNKQIADGILNFKNSIDEINGANVLLLSSVLQYLENPYEWLDKFIEKGIKYIIIDRTAISKEKRNRLTIESVPEYIYSAKYPAWFLSEEDILQKFKDKYELVLDFNSTIDYVESIPSEYKGYFFKKLQICKFYNKNSF